MAKRINIFQIDAFTDKPFTGNPAGVTFGDGLSKEEMQLIAREMNLAETAFLTKSDKADYNLRWFTPKMEVDLCGHATIASLHFLNENNIIHKDSEIKFETLSGILKCRIENNRYYMQIPIYAIDEYPGSKKDILNSLGITEEDVPGTVPFLLLSNSYLYIYIEQFSIIKKLKPNFKELLKISDENNIGGVVVFTKETYEKENSAHLRFFAPYYGIDEDPVTGSANGPLMLVLNHLGFVKFDYEDIELTFEQGDVIGRRGRIGVKYSPLAKELYISGKAVTIIKGEMNF